MSIHLTEKEIRDLETRNLTVNDLEKYRGDLEKGYPFVKLQANAQKGVEIKSFSEAEIDSFIRNYQNEDQIDVLKFVPASGAASRMFKDLYAALDSGSMNESSRYFFENISKFAFADELFAQAGMSQENTLDEAGKFKLLAALLLPDGLNYGSLPKGMIAFHKYDSNDIRTAFEEHFYEAATYAKRNGKGRIHFTVPGEAKAYLDEFLNRVGKELSSKLDSSFSIETSIQKPSTDTPAIFADNREWVKTRSGEFVFRPAGHGALLENLNELDSDIVFVKNIDNIVPDRIKADTARYKELLAGVLLSIQNEIHHFLRQHDEGNSDLTRAREFMKEWLSINTDGLTDGQVYNLLNRPIRVCGMVENEGEPGGGPFLVNEKDNVSLQIIEKAQIDLSQGDQNQILQTASHFNPVDLVLGIKDHNGKRFDLLDYRNAGTGMRVSKTYEGRPIYALELPGLWNGAMYHWNTIFVEVPISTFNPVKTVLDLVRPVHLA